MKSWFTLALVLSLPLLLAMMHPIVFTHIATRKISKVSDVVQPERLFHRTSYVYNPSGEDRKPISNASCLANLLDSIDSCHDEIVRGDVQLWNPWENWEDSPSSGPDSQIGKVAYCIARLPQFRTAADLFLARGGATLALGQGFKSSSSKLPWSIWTAEIDPEVCAAGKSNLHAAGLLNQGGGDIHVLCQGAPVEKPDAWIKRNLCPEGRIDILNSDIDTTIRDVLRRTISLCDPRIIIQQNSGYQGSLYDECFADGWYHQLKLGKMQKLYGRSYFLIHDRRQSFIPGYATDPATRGNRRYNVIGNSDDFLC